MVRNIMHLTVKLQCLTLALTLKPTCSTGYCWKTAIILGSFTSNLAFSDLYRKLYGFQKMLWEGPKRIFEAKSPYLNIVTKASKMRKIISFTFYITKHCIFQKVFHHSLIKLPGIFVDLQTIPLLLLSQRLLFIIEYRFACFCVQAVCDTFFFTFF